MRDRGITPGIALGILALTWVPLLAHAQTDTGEAEKLEEKDEEASSARPLVSAYQGTLGFISPGSPGLVAQVKVSNENGGLDTDILAQLGHVKLSDALRLDIVSEVVSIDVPTAVVPPTMGSPFLSMKSTDLFSAGARLRWTVGLAPAKQEKVDEVTDKARWRSCVQAWRDGALRAKSDTTELTNYDDVTSQQCAAVHVEKGMTEARLLESYDTVDVEKQRGLAIGGGLRFLRLEAEADDGSNTGVAGELMASYRGVNVSLFLSGTALYLRESIDRDGDLATVREAVSELGMRAGMSYEFSKAYGESQLNPQVGCYVSFTRNRWSNRFYVDGTDEMISGVRMEGAFYVSAHFSNGLSGLFSLGVQRAYGDESDLQFLVGFVPAFGQPL